jgi:CHAD domain-containing protein
VFGRDAKRFAGRMEEVQEELGAHQDSVVARQAIRELGMRAQLAGENGFTFGLLYGAEQATAASVEDRLRTIQRRTRNPKLRRWLT